MSGFPLHDWNDVRLLLACVKHGSFVGAAVALGLDQATVSRRIGVLEAMVGRPLFHRRRSGATPTAAGVLLVERALAVRAAIGDFESSMAGLDRAPSPIITIGASEGLLSYTLIPVLLGNSATSQPVDMRLIRQPLPPMAFTTTLNQSDIAVVATSAEDLPQVGGAMRIRRIGAMHFKAVASKSLLENISEPFQNFNQLSSGPVLDISLYGEIQSLSEWNGIVSLAQSENIIIASNTKSMHRMLVDGAGVGILPSYSHLYDERVIFFDFSSPSLSVSLWLVAHEDKLREPSVRSLYDTLAEMFLHSPWFR